MLNLSHLNFSALVSESDYDMEYKAISSMSDGQPRKHSSNSSHLRSGLHNFAEAILSKLKPKRPAGISQRPSSRRRLHKTTSADRKQRSSAESQQKNTEAAHQSFLPKTVGHLKPKSGHVSISTDFLNQIVEALNSGQVVRKAERLYEDAERQFEISMKRLQYVHKYMNEIRCWMKRKQDEALGRTDVHPETLSKLEKELSGYEKYICDVEQAIEDIECQRRVMGNRYVEITGEDKRLHDSTVFQLHALLGIDRMPTLSFDQTFDQTFEVKESINPRILELFERACNNFVDSVKSPEPTSSGRESEFTRIQRRRAELLTKRQIHDEATARLRDLEETAGLNGEDENDQLDEQAHIVALTREALVEAVQAARYVGWPCRSTGSFVTINVHYSDDASDCCSSQDHDDERLEEDLAQNRRERIICCYKLRTKRQIYDHAIACQRRLEETADLNIEDDIDQLDEQARMVALTRGALVEAVEVARLAGVPCRSTGSFMTISTHYSDDYGAPDCCSSQDHDDERLKEDRTDWSVCRSEVLKKRQICNNAIARLRDLEDILDSNVEYEKDQLDEQARMVALTREGLDKAVVAACLAGVRCRSTGSFVTISVDYWDEGYTSQDHDDGLAEAADEGMNPEEVEQYLARSQSITENWLLHAELDCDPEEMGPMTPHTADTADFQQRLKKVDVHDSISMVSTQYSY